MHDVNINDDKCQVELKVAEELWNLRYKNDKLKNDLDNALKMIKQLVSERYDACGFCTHLDTPCSTCLNENNFCWNGKFLNKDVE